MAATTQTPGVSFTDDGAIWRIDRGHAIAYKQFNGIYYHADTPAPVVDVLEHSRSRRERIRLYLGDTKTGRDWLDECDVEGFISNSLGPLKVPLLIHNRRSSGGPAILDHCVVKIKRTGTQGTVPYQHPAYHTGTFTIRELGANEMCGAVNLHENGYTHAVDVDGSNHANFRSLAAAERFIKKMTG